MTTRRYFLTGLLSVPFAGFTQKVNFDIEHPSVADIGFCQDMSTHHVQALAMCQRVLGRDTGDSVQAAATEVLQTQSIEVGMMRAWLTDWGQSTKSPNLVMGWMGAMDGKGMKLENMAGYATDSEMLELSQADDRTKAKRWLQLMKKHHLGGVAMARAAIELVTTEKVRRLASQQATTQTYEIQQYETLLNLY